MKTTKNILPAQNQDTTPSNSAPTVETVRTGVTAPLIGAVPAGTETNAKDQLRLEIAKPDGIAVSRILHQAGENFRRTGTASITIVRERTETRGKITLSVEENIKDSIAVMMITDGNTVIPRWKRGDIDVFVGAEHAQEDADSLLHQIESGSYWDFRKVLAEDDGKAPSLRIAIVGWIGRNSAGKAAVEATQPIGKMNKEKSASAAPAD